MKIMGERTVLDLFFLWPLSTYVVTPPLWCSVHDLPDTFPVVYTIYLVPFSLNSLSRLTLETGFVGV